MLSPFLHSLFPMPDEPAHGIFHRLAEASGLSLWTLRRRTGLSLTDLQHGRKLDELASLLESSTELIARNSFGNCDETTITVRGEKIGYQGDYSIKKRKVCPECLRQSAHHRFMWDLSFITSCPLHGLKLVDRCPCDASELTWKDLHLYRGGCCETGDIRCIAGEPAPASVKAMDAYFAGRLGLVKQTSIIALDELSLKDGVELLDRVGALKIAGYARTWTNSEKLNLAPQEVRAIGFQILSAGRFRDVLDEVYHGYLRSPSRPKPALTTIYGWFYRWYNVKGNYNFSRFLTEELLRHADGKFHIRRKVQSTSIEDGNAAIPFNEQHRTLVDLANRCGLGAADMRKIGEHFRLITPIKNIGDVLFLREDADLLVQIHENLVHKKNAASILGLYTANSVKVIDRFVARGLLIPFPPRKFRVLKQDVNRLLNSVLSRCSEDYPDDDAVSISELPRNVSVADICLAILTDNINKAWSDGKSVGLNAIMITQSDLKGIKKRLDSIDPGREMERAKSDFNYWRDRMHQL